MRAGSVELNYRKTQQQSPERAKRKKLKNRTTTKIRNVQESRLTANKVKLSHPNRMTNAMKHDNNNRNYRGGKGKCGQIQEPCQTENYGNLNLLFVENRRKPSKNYYE